MTIYEDERRSGRARITDRTYYYQQIVRFASTRVSR
jgi:hypothetical protein